MNNPLPDHLQSEYHPVLNSVPTEKIASGSRVKRWWRCSLGHEWEAQPNARFYQNQGCPYCSGKRILFGFNDLNTTHPALFDTIVAERTPNVDLKNISATSSVVLFWKDDFNHIWDMSVKNRVYQNQGCPYCAGRRVLEGFNDLATTHPDIAAQWHLKLNEKLKPTEVSKGSNRKVWWIDELEHEWEASVLKRTSGRNCPVCSGHKVVRGYNDLATLHPHLESEFSLDNSVTAEELTDGSGYKAKWICSYHHEWEATVKDRAKLLHGCPQCAAYKRDYVSQPEKELKTYIEDLGLIVEPTNRSILKNTPYKEIDLYVPEKRIGIEYNGLYWHSELSGKPNNYHQDKWIASQEVGIQLIQIWEDDWKRNPNLVKRMLAHKLGVSQERSVYARKTRVEMMLLPEMQSFLENNHIQGHSNGSYYLGLRDSERDEIVAALVLKKEPGTEGRTLNIIRYATNANVIGGFTKLLKYAERTYKPKSFITFADHTVSDGGLYENNGFVADKELRPDYMYVVRGERKHKFGYRLKRFRNDPTLKFEEGLSEKELAELNKISRIWDAGKTRYIKTLPA